MSQPKLFIGSSQRNLRVAQLLAEGLESCADVTIWREGVFGLNQGFLETLLAGLDDYDYAVFVLAPDDLTTSKDDTQPSPRDNVLFESGLFMGVLGRSHVFLVVDQSVELKIPSDLAGITLASYDGSRIADADGAAAVRKACRQITDQVGVPRVPHLIGLWQSRYPMPFEVGCPIANEVVEIRPWRDGVSITSTTNERNDHYSAFGSLPEERQIIGSWRSRADNSDTSGVFVLTVSPNAHYMYGYWTSPNETGGVVYGNWVLAKQAGTDAAGVEQRLKRAEEMLATTTFGFSPPQKVANKD